MAAISSLREEGGERVVLDMVRWHLAVRLNAVLQAVELPARISDLHSGLTDVDGDDFALEIYNFCSLLSSGIRQTHLPFCLLVAFVDDSNKILILACFSRKAANKTEIVFVC